MITYVIKNPDGPYGDLRIHGNDFADAITEFVSTDNGRNGDKAGITVEVDEDGGNEKYPLLAVARVPMGSHDRQQVIYGREARRFGRPAIGGEVLIRLGDTLPAVDAYAETGGISRAEAVRRLVEIGLRAPAPTP